MHLPHPLRHRSGLYVLLCALSLLSACASAPREWAAHASIPSPRQLDTEGAGIKLSTRRALQTSPHISPSLNLGYTTTHLLTLGAGLDVGILLDPQLTPNLKLPFPILLSAGLDVLQLGCQRFKVCHGGSAGTHAELAALLDAISPRAHRVALSVAIDQDVRFGPRSNTSLLIGLRFIPRLSP